MESEEEWEADDSFIVPDGIQEQCPTESATGRNHGSVGLEECSPEEDGSWSY